jgi:hypothetical protein
MAEDILGKVISIFSGDNEPDSEAKAVLKQILRDLNGSKYAKFVRPKSDEVETSCADFFYDIYKTVYPAQVFFQKPDIHSQLRQLCLEKYLDPSAMETSRRLDIKAVRSQSGGRPPKELAAELQGQVDSLSEAVEGRSEVINQTWNLISGFIRFVNFNYHGLLKKFDSNLVGGNFIAPPRFEVIKAEYITADVGDFLAVSQYLDPGQNWKSVLALLKSCNNGIDLIAPDLWTKLLVDLKEMKQSAFLDNFVQYTLRDPTWNWKPRTPNEKMAETWLEACSAQIQGFIDEMMHKERIAEVEGLAVAVFETADVVRLSFYNPQKGAFYASKGLDGFPFAEALNFLSAFLTDFTTKELRELCDILLIRGQWAVVAASLEMSEALHDLTLIPERITYLDDSLADDGSEGLRLKAAMVRIDRDKAQLRAVNGILSDLNDEAQDIISSAAKSLIVVARHLKNLAEDTKKNPHDLVVNWKELSSYSRTPLVNWITADYKKISYFVRLMSLYVHQSA